MVLQVWTTDTNKLASIQNLYTILLDGRLFFVKRGATIGESFKAGSVCPSFDEMRELLSNQLKAFRDLPNGQITGKTANEEDDLAMSVLMNVYWSFCIRATSAFQ